MSEIAKCPFCGENPKWVPITGWETGWKTDMLMCCGYGSTAVQGWNQYAAAMGLAQAEVAASNAIWSVPLERVESAVEAGEDMLFQAKMRVLEVFK